MDACRTSVISYFFIRFVIKFSFVVIHYIIHFTNEIISHYYWMAVGPSSSHNGRSSAIMFPFPKPDAPSAPIDDD